MNKNLKKATDLHENVPPNWYYESLKVDPLQRYWHKKRFKEIGKLIDPVKGIVLDVGSADGMFSKVILDKSKASKLIGIDVVKTSVDWAKKHWKRNKRMKFMVGDAEDLKYETNTFDAVFCLEVLEHVYQPEKVLKEFRRVMKKGGYGVFLVPSDNLLFRIIWFLWLHFYPRGWVWDGTHIQTYRDNALPKMCKEAGFEIIKDKKFILGMLHAVKVRKK
ncbi:class I SAM-dependent methyltransferase [Patescibacteria group bacterium]|nr:class I SAM-dependent methyltransferase [Patescibacteria group bacterium]MBU1066547.1 class I SAM-dependent methyltransferase [Patescibacteria group bacterium]